MPVLPTIWHVYARRSANLSRTFEAFRLGFRSAGINKRSLEASTSRWSQILVTLICWGRFQAAGLTSSCCQIAWSSTCSVRPFDVLVFRNCFAQRGQPGGRRIWRLSLSWN